MKRKMSIKAISFLVILAMLIGLLAGCGEKQQSDDSYHLYYLNQEKTSLSPYDYSPKAADENTEGLIHEFIEHMEAGTDLVEYQKVYPDEVELVRYEYNADQLYLYFNSAYSKMPADEEVLCRGAWVRTMTQIGGVSGVSFFVDNLPLQDVNGKDVGVMTIDSILDNPGEDLNDIKVADLTLYFASEDGQSLVSETQHVHYSSANISSEKLVMEQLLEGPVSANARSAMPEGTGLVSVSVMDGVCVVNLDDNFMNQDYSIREDIVIYSIVNTMTELPSVDRVQIAVNGETNMVYRRDYSLTETYSKNRDLIPVIGEDVDVDVDEQKEQKDAQQKQMMEAIIDAGK